jgi:crotonobetainyl-CoA:carnitine CoA-transferase CaiB-like acyl-CoA transferase
MSELSQFHVVNIAINAPGPVAAARLRDLGLRVTKVEPPEGDPVARLGPGWYGELTRGMDLRSIDLKSAAGQQEMEALLDKADLLLSAQRPAALERLGLGWDRLHARFPRLCHVAIVGYPPPNENVAGHDLNYQAAYGTLSPPEMPRVLVADMAGAERAVQEALALLLARERGAAGQRRLVALSDAAQAFAVTVKHDVTTPGGILGGGLPNYRLYRAKDGWLACGALELHFFQRLMAALELQMDEADRLGEIFLTRTAAEWEDWGNVRDIPLARVH